MATAFEDSLNAGTAAIIQIRSGAQPGPDEVATGTLLATLTMTADAFTGPTDAAPGALLTAASITSDTSADATGTAGHFRILTQSAGTVICEGSCGTSGADMNFNTVSITSGSTVAISAMTVTMPES